MSKIILPPLPGQKDTSTSTPKPGPIKQDNSSTTSTDSNKPTTNEKDLLPPYIVKNPNPQAISNNPIKISYKDLKEYYRLKVASGQKGTWEDIYEFHKWLAAQNYPASKLSYQVGLKHPDFIKILEGSKSHYGGNQNWFNIKPGLQEYATHIYKSLKRIASRTKEQNNMMYKLAKLKGSNSFFAKRGCGPVAAANVLAYQNIKGRLKANDDFDSLYWGSDSISLVKDKADFLKHMVCILAFLTPHLAGRWTIDNWIYDLKEYCDLSTYCVVEKEFKFTMHYTLSSTDVKETARRENDNMLIIKENNRKALAFIEFQLSHDRPVVSLLFNEGETWIKDYSTNEEESMIYHWITITKLKIDSKGDAYITVSTWGYEMVFLASDYLAGKPSMIAVEFKKLHKPKNSTQKNQTSNSARLKPVTTNIINK